jgi:hypothetical protein
MRILGVVASSSREVPNAPTIGTATDVGTGRAYNNGAATVTFTAPTWTGGLPITSYTVTSSPGGFTGTGAASPITVAGLASNTAYTFTVRATNAVGQSAASAASNSITATTVPQAPTIGTATAGNASATVAFTGNATGGKAVSTYTATSSPGSITGSSATSPITVSGLTNGTPYTFTVTATNANGTSAASAASNSVTPVNPIVSYWSIVSGGTQYFKDAAANSTANYYAGALPQQAGLTQPSTIFSYSKTASVNWQNAYYPVASPFFLRVESIKLDSSGNIIALANQRNDSGSNSKFFVGSFAPSTGASNWTYEYARSDALQTVNSVGRLVIDSSGNIYFSGMNGGSPMLVKLDSTGAVLWCTRNFYVTNTGADTFRCAVSPNYVFEVHRELTFIGKDAFTSSYVYRFVPSTGAISGSVRRIGQNSNDGLVLSSAIVADASDNAYVSGTRFTGSTYNGFVYKLNSGLTITNWFQYGINVNFWGMVRDSSNNIYVAGSTGTICYVLKLDSSLNLQWQRTVTPTNGGTLNNPALGLDETNNRLLLAAEGNSNAWAFAIPTDGSGTGTYTVGSVTIAYAAASVSTSATTVANSTTTVNVTTNQAITRGSVSYTRTATSRTVTTTTF